MEAGRDYLFARSRFSFESGSATRLNTRLASMILHVCRAKIPNSGIQKECGSMGVAIPITATPAPFSPPREKVRRIAGFRHAWTTHRNRAEGSVGGCRTVQHAPQRGRGILRGQRTNLCSHRSPAPVSPSMGVPRDSTPNTDQEAKPRSGGHGKTDRADTWDSEPSHVEFMRGYMRLQVDVVPRKQTLSGLLGYATSPKACRHAK